MGTMEDLFQLTTSQGGRLPYAKIVEPLKSFQLTTSQGGRREGAEVGHISIIFQLTTSQGGRHVPQALVQLLLQYFNSRPRKEVDLYATASALTTQIFQLTTSQGGRHASWQVLCVVTVFQLTTSQGGRPLKCPSSLSL